MAQGATVYQFEVNVSNVDRGVYESFPLRVAQHPTETPDYLLSRILALCIEYEEGMVFGQGIGSSGGDEPAVWTKDYTGQIKTWIEVGMPDPDKLHRASKAAERVLIYTHRNPDMLRRNLNGHGIYQAEHIQIHSFDYGFITSLVSRIERRNTLDVSVTEGQLYVSFNGFDAQSQIHAVPLER